MNINININDLDKTTNSVVLSEKDAASSTDGGVSNATSADERNKNAEDVVDIGTPPAWLFEAIGTNNVLEHTPIASIETNDGGIAPDLN